MPRRSCDRTSSVVSESGSIIILTAVSLVALLTTVALAIDAGNLYRARLAMQRAADAAAIATVNYVTVYGKLRIEEELNIVSQPDDKKRDEISKFVELRAKEIVKANLAIAGFPEDAEHPVSFSGEYRPQSLITGGDGQSAYEYAVSVGRNVDYYLMGHFNSAFQQASIAANSTARRRIANVALVLDVSESMGCPVTGDCSCLGTAGGCTGPTRMSKLLDGVGRFLELFDLNTDRISIVPFNMASDPMSIPAVKDLYAKKTGAKINELTSEEIEKLMNIVEADYHPGSVTNLCDGLRSARDYAFGQGEFTKSNKVPVPAGAAMNYILFTDGNPTGGRFIFNDAKAGLETTKFSVRDYLHHSVKWVTNKKEIFVGPGMLIKTGGVGFDHADPTPPNTTEARPSCGPGTLLVGKSKEDVSKVTQSVFGNCLNSMCAKLPGDTTPNGVCDAKCPTCYGQNYDMKTAANRDRWREMYFACGIQYADHLRTNERSTFFTLGYGTENNAVDPNDPFQGIDDTTSLKSKFLVRLTLDPDLSIRPAGVMDFPYTGYRTFSQARVGAQDRVGEYVPAPEDADLDNLFQRVAHKVLLRLVLH